MAPVVRRGCDLTAWAGSRPSYREVSGAALRGHGPTPGTKLLLEKHVPNSRPASGEVGATLRRIMGRGCQFVAWSGFEALVLRSLRGSIAWTWADTAQQTSTREASSQQSSGIWGGQSHIAAIHGSGVPICSLGRFEVSRA
jgi:hypothetical protein